MCRAILKSITRKYGEHKIVKDYANVAICVLWPSKSVSIDLLLRSTVGLQLCSDTIWNLLSFISPPKYNFLCRSSYFEPLGGPLSLHVWSGRCWRIKIIKSHSTSRYAYISPACLGVAVSAIWTKLSNIRKILMCGRALLSPPIFKSIFLKALGTKKCNNLAF